MASSCSSSHVIVLFLHHSCIEPLLHLYVITVWSEPMSVAELSLYCTAASKGPMNGRIDEGIDTGKIQVREPLLLPSVAV